MGRRAAEQPKSVQVNVRLTVEDNEDLQTLAYLEDCNAAELVRRLIETELNIQRRDPAFAEIRQACEVWRQRRQAQVVHLGARRRAEP